MQFETLRQELTHGAEIIQQLVAGISQEDAQFKPNPETWSMLEVVCHLHDEECEDFREHLDFILNRPQEEWPSINPQGWVIVRKYNEQNLQGMLEKFLEERQKSLEWLKGLATANWEAEVPTPFGFKIKAGDMLASWAAHDTLHIRQLVELRHTHVEQLTAPYNLRYAGDW